MANEVDANGWHAVPLDPSKIFRNGSFNHEPGSLTIDEIRCPLSDPIVPKVYGYASEHLPPQTLNHSMRVYYYGKSSNTTNQSTVCGLIYGFVAMAILQQQFPEHADKLSPTTLAVTSLLHDLGATPENMSATRMSFEFYGALQARTLLLDPSIGTSQDMADAAFETIIRHQDLGTEGTITFLGQLIQLATVYDNVGEHPSVAGLDKILHVSTRESVMARFPRKGWLGCFAKTVKEEVERKPWCHTTHIPEFAEKIEGNKLMRQYE